MVGLALAVVFIFSMVGSCSASDSVSSSGSTPSPKTAEEAASHYYYDSAGHLHRDY